MPIIAIVNTKGGVGKTSTVFHLAAAWAQEGKKILIVDADPQASITSGFWGQDALDEIPIEETIHELFVSSPLPSRLIQESPIKGVDFVPGHEEMETWMLPLKHQESTWAKLEGSIKRLTDLVSHQYHHILVDTPPNLALLTHAALTAADFAVVPVQPEDFGIRGLTRVSKAMARVQEARGGWPWMLGYLVIMAQKNKETHTLYERKMRAAFVDQVFDCVIPDAHDYVKALATFKPLVKVNKKGVAFQAIDALKNEIDARLLQFHERSAA